MFPRNRAEIGILDILLWIKYHIKYEEKKEKQGRKDGALSLPRPVGGIDRISMGEESVKKFPYTGRDRLYSIKKVA